MTLRDREQRRLRELEALLATYDDKRAIFEQALAIEDSVPKQFSLGRELKNLHSELTKLEIEYAEILARIEDKHLPEAEAVQLLGELESAVRSLERSKQELPDQMRDLIREMRKHFAAPEKTATAKLKLSLPIVPLLASLEFELDTRGLLSHIWGKLGAFFSSRATQSADP